MNVHEASVRRMNQRLAAQFYSQVWPPDAEPRRRSSWVRFVGFVRRLAYRFGMLERIA